MTNTAIHEAAINTSHSLNRRILSLTWPVLAENTSIILAQTINLSLVAPLGTVAVAAIGISTLPLFLFLGPLIGLSIGVNALITRAFGENNQHKVELTTRNGLWLGIWFSFIITGILFLGAEQIIRWMGADPEIVSAATLYLKALCPGLAAMFLTIVIGGVIRAVGKPHIPFLVGIFSNLLNVLLDWVLIYGEFGAPELGLIGAGIASTISRVLACFILLLFILTREKGYFIDISKIIRLNRPTITSILKIGLPASVDRVFDAINYLVYTRLIAFLGTSAIATHYTIATLEQFPWMVGMALSTAISVLVGQSLGANASKEARTVIYKGIFIALLSGLCACGLVLIFPRELLYLFSDDISIPMAAILVLQLAGLGQIPSMISLVLQGGLAGAGDTKTLVWISGIGGWVVRLTLTWFLAIHLGWGLAGAWIASIIDVMVRAILLAMRLLQGKWLHQKF